ncbi:MAG TPA: amidase [Burkholderiales bacterium]|nr:amidase [Burkholderiales bacterium]
MSPLHYLTLEEASAGLKSGALSAVDLTRAALSRIAALDPTLHAYITVTSERAMEDAERATREIRDGAWRGPLHGIPIALKDIVSTRGIRTTAHSRALLDWVPSEDAPVYDNLRKAGCVLLGKTSLHEFAYGNPVRDEPFPAARNPWNTDYAPGRSSSGSGAAVAAGLCYAAIGTDTGGSIRHPAAVCGIVGMKPTFGRVSCFGVIPLAADVDHAGPMTRTVRDNALMLQAIAGFDPRDPFSVDEPVPDFCGEIGRDLHGLSIGVPYRFLEALPMDASVAAAFEEAVRVLSALGAEVTSIDIPDLADTIRVGARLVMRQAYEYHRDGLERHPERYGKAFRERVLNAAAFTAEDIEAARAARSRLRASVAKIHASGVAIIASPTKEVDAETMDSLYDDPVDTRPGTIRVHNMTGAPAISVPMGFGATGVPVGLQLAAPQWREPLLYRVAAAYEGATPWTRRRPLP